MTRLGEKINKTFKWPDDSQDSCIVNPTRIPTKHAARTKPHLDTHHRAAPNAHLTRRSSPTAAATRGPMWMSPGWR